jgi:hypothetical protein
VAVPPTTSSSDGQWWLALGEEVARGEGKPARRGTLWRGYPRKGKAQPTCGHCGVRRCTGGAVAWEVRDSGD